MKIGVIGCGYVFDHYMTTFNRHPAIEIAGVADRDAKRAAQVGAYYDLRVYEDTATLLADPEVEIVANFTSIESHYDVSRAALEAGKHVYSEKPLTTTMDEAQALADLAAKKGLRLSCAPSNALSSSVQTLWKAVHEKAVGDVRMVYAEFDDNPVYLLAPETWRSRSGAPWPYLHEYEMGCTWEHVGYHLTWMCAIFGPVRAVTAFSKMTLPDKTGHTLEPADTPDFSVACLDFESGVVGRITCSIAGPVDHRMRIIGNCGVLSTDTYRDYQGPVYLEAFTNLALKGRNLRFIRESTFFQRLLGIGGQRLPLVQTRTTDGGQHHPDGSRFTRWKAAQRGQQDKSIGLAELADAITNERAHFPPTDFTLHLTELTHLIQKAGPDGLSVRPSTRFAPLSVPEHILEAAPNYQAYRAPSLIPRLLGAREIVPNRK